MRFRPALMRLFFALLIFLGPVGFSCPTAFGQSAAVGTGQTLNGETYVPAPGTGHDTVHLLSENVNLATGTVSLGVTMPGRSGGRFTVPATWDFATPPYHVALSAGNALELERTFTQPSNVPLLMWSESSFTPPQNPSPNAPNQVQCNFATGFTFTDRNGASHNIGLGVLAKAVNAPNNGDGPCVAGQGAVPFASDGSVWAAFTSQSGTVTEVGSWTGSGPVGGIVITDKDGVTYSFGGDCGRIGIWNGPCYNVGTVTEDRNGNYPEENTINSDPTFTPPQVITGPALTVNYSVPYQHTQNSQDTPGGEAVACQ